MDNPRIDNFSHIAVVQTAFLGDTALSLYLAERIGQLARNSRLTFVTTPQAAPIARLSTAIDEVVPYDKRDRKQSAIGGIKKIASELVASGVNCIISPHRSLRSTMLMRRVDPLFSVSFETSAMSFLYSKRVKYNPRLHEAERQLSLLSGFDIPDDQLALPNRVGLRYLQEDTDVVDRLIGNSTKKIIVLAPGSVWETKKWLPTGYSALCSMLAGLGFRVMAMGGKADADLCSMVAGAKGENIAGRLTIPQSVELLARAELLISNDSAPVHFAALADCPTAAIFGATSPMFGFGPLSKKNIVIERDGLRCRPCRIHGSRSCPLDDFACMAELKPEYVLRQALSIIDYF